MVNALGEDPTKMTIINVSLDKQKALKRDYINMELEIGVSNVLLCTL